jgi:hypothetical protein
VTVAFGATGAGPVLIEYRSAWGTPPPLTTTVETVLVLLVLFGSVTPDGGAIVAVLTIVPDAAPVPITMKVTLPPAGSIAIVVLMFPEPAAVPQLAPAVALPQVQVTPVNGGVSVKMAPLAAPGPALVTRMV